MKVHEFKKPLNDINDSDYRGSFSVDIGGDGGEDVSLSLDVYHNGDETDAVYYDLGLTIRSYGTKVEVTMTSADLKKMREAIDAL